MDQDHKAGRAFDESADRRTVSGTHDAVTLPMPDLHRAGVSVCGIAHEAERPRRSHESFAATPTVVAATCLRRRSG